MPIKTRRYRKRNNKSRRTRKNKTTRRYKKQMKGGNGLIKNEEELKKSWENKSVIAKWIVNDGEGFATQIYREDAENKQMPYEDFEKLINRYLEKVKEGKKGAKIEEVYY